MAPERVKIVPENITMFHLEFVRFQLKEVSTRAKEGFELNLSHKVMHNVKDEQVKITLSIRLNDVSGNEAVSDLDFHFNVKGLQSFYNLNESGVPLFSKSFITTLLGIGFSTARGLLYERFIGTTFNGIILPVIAPQKMLQKGTINSVAQIL